MYELQMQVEHEEVVSIQTYPGNQLNSCEGGVVVWTPLTR